MERLFALLNRILEVRHGKQRAIKLIKHMDVLVITNNYDGTYVLNIKMPEGWKE